MSMHLAKLICTNYWRREVVWSQHLPPTVDFFSNTGKQTWLTMLMVLCFSTYQSLVGLKRKAACLSGCFSSTQLLWVQQWAVAVCLSGCARQHTSIQAVLIFVWQNLSLLPAASGPLLLTINYHCEELSSVYCTPAVVLGFFHPSAWNLEEWQSAHMAFFT